MLKVLFLHGLESLPGGTKPEALELTGCEVANPALPKDDFDLSVKIAQEFVEECQPDIIVGSSRGGAVAMALCNESARLVLIAPAWKNYGVEPKVPSETQILHCSTDDIVEYKDSVRLAALNHAKLTTCGVDHRMNDEDAIKFLVRIVNE